MVSGTPNTTHPIEERKRTSAPFFGKTGVAVFVFCLLMLCGCGKGGEAPDRPAASEESASKGYTSEESASEEFTPFANTADPPAPAAPSTAFFPPEAEGAVPGSVVSAYDVPAPLVSAFHEDRARGENGALIDLSGAADGYVGVSAVSAGRLKFQVIKDGETYTYDIRQDGTPSIFPLQMEDGMYSFRVLENVSGTKYAVLYATDETISMADQYRPYLCASDYVSYDESSACVKKAKELAASAEDANGLISAVYDYICASVKYDKEKAKTVTAGYLPVPDETMKTGKGICFDYASLAAAMLRSQGVPCKVIFGYVSPKDLYHAWNMFYTQESGWVTASFEMKGRNWNRMDLTFASNGADGTFIGDGSNYKDVYCY